MSTELETTSTSNVQGLVSLHNAVLENLSLIQSADNVIDSKANNILAASLVILVLIVDKIHLNSEWYILRIISVLLLILSVELSVWLTRIQNYFGALPDLNSHTEYFAKGNKDLLLQIIRDADYGAERNLEKLGNKRKIFKWLVLSFLAGAGFGIISLFIKIKVNLI